MIAWAWLGLLFSRGFALSAAPPLPGFSSAVHFSRRIWQSSDGLPEDFAQALAQTPDGYLWIGTSGGLVRFDGIRFTVFSSQTDPAFHDDSVYSLLVARDGTLWAGTEGGGLIRYRDGAFRSYGPHEGLANGFVRVIFEDRSGVLWAGTDDGLYRLQGESLVRVDGRNGIPPIAVHSICQDRQGRLLFGGYGLLVLDGSTAAYYTSSETLADNSIRTIHQTVDGTLWIGTISGLRRLGRGLDGNPFLAPKIIRNTNVDFLMQSRSGPLWIGTYGQGVLRYWEGRFERFSAPALLPHNNVLSIFEDMENDIWIGTQGGLLRLSPSAAITLTTADGTPQSINTVYQDPAGALFATALNGRLFRVARRTLEPARLPRELAALPIRNVFRDSRGALWFGTDGQGAARWWNGAVTRFTMKQGLVNDFIRAFCEDREGAIWIGTDGGLSCWRHGVFRNFNTRDGLAYGSIRALTLDRDGSLWVATDGGLSHFRGGQFVSHPLLTRFRGEKVWAIYQDGAGGLWIGTHGAGLFFLKKERLAQIDARNGLPSNKIHFIIEGPGELLWMSGPAGVFSVARADLEAVAQEPSRELAVRVYTTSDGLSTNQMNGGVQPAGALSANGELWFPSANGLVCIQPRVLAKEYTPPVLIEEVLADGRSVRPASEIRAGPGAGKIEVRYTAIRLRSPERTHFRYWLENFDKEWTDAGQRRIAYYTNLPAGHYRFHVVAYEPNDPHHASERVLDIRWRPHFYQTAWFGALCALLATMTGWGGYQLHVRNIRKRFAAVLEERNRLAREMHDTLIQGCIGVSTLLEAASSAQRVSPEVSAELMDRARNEVRAAVDEARLAVWNLRQNAGDADLVAAAAQLVVRVENETGIPVKFETSGSPSPLGAEAAASLLMLIREALHNALHHGAPRHLSVSLVFRQDALELQIEDDGSGFDPAAAGNRGGYHYGLIGMRERVAKLRGDLHLESAPGCGTRLRLTIPRSLGPPLRRGSWRRFWNALS